MNRVVVLMYHALYENARGLDAIAPEDRPYAVSTADFARQLDMLRDAAIPVIDPARLETGKTGGAGVILTFDDGHASNAELALPLLAERGLAAAFFVTTGFIGQRPGYCSWEQLRTLSRAGILIGGHGHTHRFLSDLAPSEQDFEFSTSRKLLEENLKQPVKQMSFPGGRFNTPCILRAQAAGFSLLYGSEIGTLQAHMTLKSTPQPRIAIRARMTDPAFMAYAQARFSRMFVAQIISALKTTTKHVIGNEFYHRLYSQIKG